MVEIEGLRPSLQMIESFKNTLAHERTLPWVRETQSLACHGHRHATLDRAVARTHDVTLCLISERAWHPTVHHDQPEELLLVTRELLEV